MLRLPSTMARLYISQDRLDAWSAENKVELEGDIMTLVGDGRSFKLHPAVRFLKVVGSDEDPHELLDKVKDTTELANLGADHMASSVIYVETAYEVQNGFVGDPVVQDSKPGPRRAKGRFGG